MKRLIIFIALLLTLCGHAQTTNVCTVTWDLSDFALDPFSVSLVKVQPLASLGTNGNSILLPHTFSRPTDLDGSLTISNVTVGFSYRVTLYLEDSPNAIAGLFTNYFPTNISGQSVNAVNYLNFVPATNFQLIPTLTAGSNIVIATNLGGSVPTNYVINSTGGGAANIAVSNVSGAVAGLSTSTNGVIVTITETNVSGVITNTQTNVTLSGTFTGNVSGAASTATNFTGSLAGNITGTQGATVVSSVGSARLPAGQIDGTVNSTNFPGGLPTLSSNFINNGMSYSTITNLFVANGGGTYTFKFGDYTNWTNWVVPFDNVSIYGYGAILHQATNLTGYAVYVPETFTNVHFYGLTASGDIFVAAGSTLPNPIVPGTYDYNYTTSGGSGAAPASARSGFKCNMNGKNSYQDLTATGFNIAGFYLYNTNGSSAPDFLIGTFLHNKAVSSYIGFYLNDIHVNDFDTNGNYIFVDGAHIMPEYTKIEGCQALGCTWGIDFSAGNVSVIGGNFNSNYVDATSLRIVNGLHGSFVGCSINHNVSSGLALKISLDISGEVFAGCQFRGGSDNVMIDGSGLITFAACEWDNGWMLFTNNTGPIIFGESCIPNVFGTMVVTNDGTGLVTNWTTALVTNNQQQTYAGGTITATNFSGNGGNVTNLSASQLAGQVPSGNLTNYPALNATLNNFANSGFFGGNIGFGGQLSNYNGVFKIMQTGETQIATNLEAQAVTVYSLTATNAISGPGSGITGLNGSSIASGTVADARLSANVALLNGGQTYNPAPNFSAGFTNGGRVYTGNTTGWIWYSPVSGTITNGLWVTNFATSTSTLVSWFSNNLSAITTTNQVSLLYTVQGTCNTNATIAGSAAANSCIWIYEGSGTPTNIVNTGSTGNAGTSTGKSQGASYVTLTVTPAGTPTNMVYHCQAELCITQFP